MFTPLNLNLKNKSSSNLEIIVTAIIRKGVKLSWNPFRTKLIAPNEEIVYGSRQPFLQDRTKSYPRHNVDYFEVQIFRQGFKDRREIFINGTWEITDDSFIPNIIVV
jgi:hypothetical protein